MKKALAICMFVLMCGFLFSCDSGKSKGEFLGVAPDEGIGNLRKAFVIDQEMALKIGDVILEQVLGEEFIKSSRFIVYEAEGKDYFVVFRTRCTLDQMGGGISVAINKADGKILAVWLSD